MFFLFFILFILSFGLKWFSFDIPYEFKSTTITKSVTLSSIFGGQAAEQELKLGQFNSWTSFQIQYTSSGGEVGINIGRSSTVKNNDISTWTQQGSLKYRIYASKEVSLFLIYSPRATYPSQLGDPAKTTITMDININQPKILPTNFIFISMIPIIGYLGIARGSRESWVDSGKYQLDRYKRIDARRVYKNNTNLCDLCGKDRIEVIVGANSNLRYCSKTCDYIDHKEISILIYYIMIFLSIFAPILILIDILGLIFIVYIIESDSDELRFKNYEKSKEHEKEMNENLFARPNQKLIKEKIDHEPMKFVEELSESFPVCCYQTARLGEVFCECGRTIPQNLIDFLTS